MDHVHPPHPHEIQIYRYILDTNIIFIKSHDNYHGYLKKHLKLYLITLFHIGSSAYYQMLSFMKVLSYNYADDA